MSKRKQVLCWVLVLVLVLLMLSGCSKQKNTETENATVAEDKASEKEEDTEHENITADESAVSTEKEHNENGEWYARFLTEDEKWDELRDIDKKDIETIAAGNIVSQDETVSLGGFGYKVNEVQYFSDPHDAPNHTAAEADELLSYDIYGTSYKDFFYVTLTITNETEEEMEFRRDYMGIIGFDDIFCPFPGENYYVKDMEGNNQLTILLQPEESKDICMLFAVPDYVSLEWDKPENLENPDFYFRINKAHLGAENPGNTMSGDPRGMYIKCNVKNWK